LAVTISAGFEQILNNPSGGVVAELKLLRNEIENLGNKLKDPATDLTQNIVKELQESMGRMVNDFKVSMSGDTKNEMERLANLLGQAGGSLMDFPTKLQLMTDNLNENIKGLQEIVKQVTQQTLTQSEQATVRMVKEITDMGGSLKDRVADLQAGQEALLSTQTKNIQVSEGLLNAFNSSIEKMSSLSGGFVETIKKISQAQSELERMVSTFRNISQEVNVSSTKFGESQVTFSKYTNEFLRNNSSIIEEIQKSLMIASDVSDDYAKKFDVIEKGLQEIFKKINLGLNDYQSTVSQSLESFLGNYTEHLTKTAESLAAASSKQEDILEELSEQLSKLNMGK
jgi:methyl-accepting chemotaxis protein